MDHGRGRHPGGRPEETRPWTVRPAGTAARRLAWAGIPLVALVLGCGIAPRNFRSLTHPAPIVRARSVAFGEGLPESQVVPALIDRLDDPDPVVRLTAHEELRRRTGQNFGYVPWAPAPERTHAVQSWRAWWQQRQAGTAGLRPNP
jgi:hypothetical protein